MTGATTSVSRGRLVSLAAVAALIVALVLLVGKQTARAETPPNDTSGISLPTVPLTLPLPSLPITVPLTLPVTTVPLTLPPLTLPPLTTPTVPTTITLPPTTRLTLPTTVPAAPTTTRAGAAPTTSPAPGVTTAPRSTTPGPGATTATGGVAPGGGAPGAPGAPGSPGAPPGADGATAPPAGEPEPPDPGGTTPPDGVAGAQAAAGGPPNGPTADGGTGADVTESAAGTERAVAAAASRLDGPTPGDRIGGYAFPIGLALLIFGFLVLQHRLDHDDPKITDAPLDGPAESLPFLARSPGIPATGPPGLPSHERRA